MKKYFLAILGIMVALSFSSGAGAITIGDAYFGGTVNNYTVFNDVIGDTTGAGSFQVDSLGATKSADGKTITVVLSGTYFSSGYATGAYYGGLPGDLYISSTGWRMDSPNNNGDTDKFLPSEGWDYVIKYSNTGVTSLYHFGGAYTPTSNVGIWSGYRSDQAFQGGYSGPAISTNATSVLGSNTLTFTFDNSSLNWDPALIGYHWTMACGNDVIEGGGTPVPEPGTLFLLGLGFLGLVVSRLRK